MSCHPEPDSHIGDKIKVALDCQIILLTKQNMLQKLIQLV